MRGMTLLPAGLALAIMGVAAQAESPTVHHIVDPATIIWGAGPAALQPGAKSTLLYGDPTKEGLFVMRLWLPKGFRVAPHTHPRPEILTIMSGSFLLGMGADADKAKTRRLGAGKLLRAGPGHAPLRLHGRGNGDPDQHDRSVGGQLCQPGR